MKQIENPAAAIIYIDGEEFMRLDAEDDFRHWVHRVETEEEWNEIALMVYKPRYGIYLREILKMR